MALGSSLFPQKKQSNNAQYQPSIGLANPYQPATPTTGPYGYGTPGGMTLAQIAQMSQQATQALPMYGQPGGATLGGIAGMLQQPTNPMAVSTVVPPAPMAPVAPVVPVAPAPVIDPNADAARLFAGSVAGNPFISPEGLARLQGGLVPDLNMINPAFYQYTSPVIQQALQGLYTARGQRPEDVAFTQNLWRPGGLR